MTKINIVNTFQADGKSKISWEIYDYINDGVSVEFYTDNKAIAFYLLPPDAEELAKNLIKAAGVNRKSYSKLSKSKEKD